MIHDDGAGAAMTPAQELAWLAGILEGEGWFAAAATGSRHHKHFAIHIQTSDKDVVERVQQITGFYGVIGVVCKPDCKTQYHVAVSGDRGRWLAGLIYPFMLARRQARILELGATQ